MLLSAIALQSVLAVPACRESAADRSFAVPVTESHATFSTRLRTSAGAPLRLYLDSGGGGPFIFEDAALRVAPSGKLTLACGSALPFVTRFGIAPARLRAQDPIEGSAMDGVLGGAWFDHHVWTWDYARGLLLLRPPGDDPAVPREHVVTLGFQSKNGRHTTGFPRIAASIDGATYQFLLDTGAHTRVTARARRIGGLPGTPFATNFIEKSIAQRWHRDHPSWPYIAQAEIVTRADMIRVSGVTIGGYRTAHAWFTVRPDSSYANFMSAFMDRPVVGSIGGETLKHFRVTIDYRKEKAYLEIP